MQKTDKLTIDRTKIQEDTLLDGKYLLTISDKIHNAANITQVYKNSGSAKSGMKPIDFHFNNQKMNLLVIMLENHFSWKIKELRAR